MADGKDSGGKAALEPPLGSKATLRSVALRHVMRASKHLAMSWLNTTPLPRLCTMSYRYNCVAFYEQPWILLVYASIRRILNTICNARHHMQC